MEIILITKIVRNRINLMLLIQHWIQLATASWDNPHC